MDRARAAVLIATGHFVIGVQDRVVRRRLVYEQAAFGFGVLLESVMAIQRSGVTFNAAPMWARNVSVVSNWKLESSRTFHCSSREVATMAHGGVPMLPPTCAGMPAGLQEWPGHRGGRCFSVGPSDADRFAFEEPTSEFQIADHTNA
ncbi:MAG: hypothetical protein WDO18_00925 [Acidobacteriota bacterium]